MKSGLEELLGAFGIAFAAMLLVYAASRRPAGEFDPRWVAAALLAVQTVFLAYIAAWAWGIHKVMIFLADVLRGDIDEVHPSFRGIVQMFVSRVAEMVREIRDAEE